MRIPALSERMKAITNLVTEGNSICDVGCDHGYVSIYLTIVKHAKKAVAMDVRTGPLSLAKEHIEEYGLSDIIDTRISDGLQKLEIGETESCIIAGMGGNLMMHILQEGEKKAKSFRELVLQPQSQLEEFRVFLRKEGYEIVAEDMIFEEGKYYPMMRVVPGRTISEDTQNQLLFDRYGKLLLQNQNEVLKNYLLKAYQNNRELFEHLSMQQGEKSESRMESLRAEQEGIKEALAKYYSVDIEKQS